MPTVGRVRLNAIEKCLREQKESYLLSPQKSNSWKLTAPTLLIPILDLVQFLAKLAENWKEKLGANVHFPLQHTKLL